MAESEAEYPGLEAVLLHGMLASQMACNPLDHAIASASGEFLKEHPAYLIVFLFWASTEKEIVYFSHAMTWNSVVL